MEYDSVIQLSPSKRPRCLRRRHLPRRARSWPARCTTTSSGRWGQASRLACRACARGLHARACVRVRLGTSHSPPVAPSQPGRSTARQRARCAPRRWSTRPRSALSRSTWTTSRSKTWWLWRTCGRCRPPTRSSTVRRTRGQHARCMQAAQRAHVAIRGARVVVSKATGALGALTPTPAHAAEPSAPAWAFNPDGSRPTAEADAAAAARLASSAEACTPPSTSGDFGRCGAPAGWGSSCTRRVALAAVLTLVLDVWSCLRQSGGTMDTNAAAAGRCCYKGCAAGTPRRAGKCSPHARGLARARPCAPATPPFPRMRVRAQGVAAQLPHTGRQVQVPAGQCWHKCPKCSH